MNIIFSDKKAFKHCVFCFPCFCVYQKNRQHVQIKIITLQCCYLLRWFNFIKKNLNYENYSFARTMANWFEGQSWGQYFNEKSVWRRKLEKLHVIFKFFKILKEALTILKTPWPLKWCEDFQKKKIHTNRFPSHTNEFPL